LESLEAFKNLKKTLTEEDLKSILESVKNLEVNSALGLMFPSKSLGDF
jgi:hypothetical protein